MRSSHHIVSHYITLHYQQQKNIDIRIQTQMMLQEQEERVYPQHPPFDIPIIVQLSTYAMSLVLHSSTTFSLQFISLSQKCKFSLKRYTPTQITALTLLAALKKNQPDIITATLKWEEDRRTYKLTVRVQYQFLQAVQEGFRFQREDMSQEECKNQKQKEKLSNKLAELRKQANQLTGIGCITGNITKGVEKYKSPAIAIPFQKTAMTLSFTLSNPRIPLTLSISYLTPYIELYPLSETALHFIPPTLNITVILDGNAAKQFQFQAIVGDNCEGQWMAVMQKVKPQQVYIQAIDIVKVIAKAGIIFGVMLGINWIFK